MPDPNSSRPLSPHLQTYRLPLSALLSISHRMSGMALAIGMFALAGFLWSVASGEANCFESMKRLYASPVGLIMLGGWSLAFFYHLCAGIRHLIWDTGKGFAKPVYQTTNWVVIGAALALTAGTWWHILGGVK